MCCGCGRVVFQEKFIKLEDFRNICSVSWKNHHIFKCGMKKSSNYNAQLSQPFPPVPTDLCPPFAFLAQPKPLAAFDFRKKTPSDTTLHADTTSGGIVLMVLDLKVGAVFFLKQTAYASPLSLDEIFHFFKRNYDTDVEVERHRKT